MRNTHILVRRILGVPVLARVRSAIGLVAAVTAIGCASPAESSQQHHARQTLVIATSASDKPETVYVWDLSDQSAPRVRIYHCRSTFPFVADQSSWTEVKIPEAPTQPR
jgi:hypothetical protein